MMPIKYYSSVTAVFILQIICSGKISTTASTTGLAEETADPTTLISDPPASYSSNSSTSLKTVPTSHTYLSSTEVIGKEGYGTLDLLSTQKNNKSDTTLSTKLLDLLSDSSTTNTLISDAATDTKSTSKIGGTILKTNSVTDAYSEFGYTAKVFTGTSSVSGSKTSSTKELITDAVHISTKALTNLNTNISTTSKQIVTSTAEKNNVTPASIGDNTNVLYNDLSTIKTVIVTPEKTSTLSPTIIQEKITHQTTISIDMVSNKTEKNTTQTETPFYAFKTSADEAKTQTAQDNKTTQSIRQIGTTTDTDKIEDKQTTTEIIYINNSPKKQATTQLSSTVNDMSVTFGDTKAHTATSSDPNTSKAVQTTTQAATTKNTTDASITSSNNIVYVSAKEQHLFTTIIKVTSPVEQTATKASSAAEAVTTTSDASKLLTEQSTNHATTSSSGIIATTSKLTTKQTPTSGLITTKGDTTTSTINGAATTKMETLYDSKRFTSKQDIKQTMSSNDSNNTTTNNTTKSNQGATQTSTRMFPVAPFESTTDKVLLTDNSSVECISMENRTLSASEIITSTMKQSDFEAEAKSTAKSDREQITTDKTEHKSTITFEAKSSERSTLQGYPTATREDVTLAFDSPVTSFITTKTNDVSTYSSTTEYQQEIASAEITKNELQSISTVMTTTEDVSSSIGHSAKKQSQNLHSTEKTILISTESTTSKTISFKDQDATTQTKTTSAPERTSFETNQESTITAEQSNTMSTLSKAKLDITSALIQATFSTISDEQYGRSFLNQTSTSDRQSITPSLFQTTIRTNSKSDTPISDKQSITSETVTNNNNTSDTQTHTTVSIDQTSNGTSSLQPDSSPRFTKARETTIFKSLSNSFTTRDPTSDSSTSDKQSNSTQRFGITSSLQFDTTTTMSEAVDTMTTLIQSGRSTTIGQMSIATSSSVEKSSAPLMIKTSDRTMLQTQYYSKSTKIQTEDTTAILQRSRSTPPEVTSTGSPSETQTSYSNPSNPSTEVSYTADSTTGNTQYMVTSVYSTPLEVQSQVSTKETQTTHHFDKSSTKSQSSDSITLSKTSDSTSSQTKYDNNSTMIHTEGTTALFKVRESTPPDIQSPVSTKETQTTNHFDNSSPKSQSSNAIFLGGTSGGTLSQTKYHTKSAMIQTEGTTSLLPISGRSSPKIQSKSSTTETQTIDSSSQKSQSSNAVSIKTISKSTLPQTQFEGKSTIIQTEGTITLFQISDSTPPSYTSADSTLETRTSDSVSQKYQYSNAMTLNKISDSTLPQAQFDGTSTINQTEGTITLLQISGNTPSEVTSTVSTLETQTMNSNTSSEVYYTADSKTGKTQFMGTSISIDTTKQNTQSNLKAVSSIENTYMYGNTISVQQPTDSTPTVDNTPVTQSNDSVLSEIYGKSTTILRAADNTAQSERITAIDHTTESFISISNSQSNTLGNKKEYTTTIRTLNYSSPSLAPQFQETNRTPDIPLNYVTNVIQTSGRTTSQPELDTTTVLNTGNKISVTKYAKNTTETLTTENMTSATLSYRQNTLQTITQSPTDITDIQKNPLHRETTILNQPDTTPYSPDVTTEFLYSTTTQKVDHCNSFPCADGGICTSLSSTDSVCQCNSSKCGTYAENPCDNMENPPCVSDGVVHTCLLKTDGNFTCVCQKGYTNEGVYCIDIDECSANNYTCDVTYGVCNNTVGSYICSCSDGFVLGPGNTCTDRDGKWSDWESWSACTFTCGAGLQTRTRTCSSPSQAGFGDNCTLGHSLGTQTCNNVLCPATLDEQTYGVTIYLEGLTKDQLNSVETPFKQLVADIVNTYCNYNASNVQQCCQTSSSYSSNPSNPVTFTTSNNIAFGSGTPLEINNLLAVMIVIKYESNNALCRAALASVGRRRRSVILGELELALPQDIFEQIIANPDLQGNLTQSLVNAIDAQLGISLNITVSAVTLVTTTTTASSSTQGIVESNDTEPWVIGVAVVGAFLSLILIILGLALIFRLKMKTKVAPLQESNREEEDIN